MNFMTKQGYIIYINAHRVMCAFLMGCACALAGFMRGNINQFGKMLAFIHSTSKEGMDKISNRSGVLESS